MAKRAADQSKVKHIEILHVEDDAGDALLAKRAFGKANISNTLHWTKDGIEALEFLYRKGKFFSAPRPDLILLDLNMPRMNGFEFLKTIKADSQLMSIPVIVLTTSDSDHDVENSYRHQASCYISKPLDLSRLTRLVQSIESFWLDIVLLPSNRSRSDIPAGSVTAKEDLTQFPESCHTNELQ